MQKFVEHEPMVVTTRGTIPQSALHEVNEQAKRWAPPPDLKPKKRDKTCPIRANRYDGRCDTSCVFFTETGCGIVEHRMGNGTTCPFPGMTNCSSACAFCTDGGCAMTKGRENHA